MYVVNAMVVSEEDTVIHSYGMRMYNRFPDDTTMEILVKDLYDSCTSLNPLYKIGGLKRFLKKHIINFQVYEILNPDTLSGNLPEILHEYCPEINTMDDLRNPKVLQNYSFEDRKRICERAISYRFYLYDYSNKEMIEIYEVVGGDIVYADRRNITENYKPKYSPGQRINSYQGIGTVVGIIEDAVPFSYVMWSPEQCYIPDISKEYNIQCKL